MKESGTLFPLYENTPRQAPIDAPGALHHIIIRGIERTAIFADDKDRENFAGIVKDVKPLAEYPFTGHSALMGKADRPWQDTRYVLALFGNSLSEARRNLRRHVAKWALKGRCPELTGGGLIRSAGGWREVKEAYRDGIRLASDERILGSSEFVEKTLKESGEEYDRRLRLHSPVIDLSSVIDAVCRYFEVDPNELAGPTRRAEMARASALISHMATQDLPISGAEVARRLNIDRSAISRMVQRVRQDAELSATAKAIWRRIAPH